jgi:hypothetical protein
MIPVVQKELGLKDEESAKKLFFRIPSISPAWARC